MDTLFQGLYAPLGDWLLHRLVVELKFNWHCKIEAAVLSETQLARHVSANLRILNALGLNAFRPDTPSTSKIIQPCLYSHG